MTTELRFGRYEILGTLGQGGFATVYRAWDPLLGREVALKALLPHLAADRRVRQRFLAEAQAIAHLRHPNIVQFFEVGETDKQPYFTMELLEGQTLAQRMSSGVGLSLDETVSILEPLCSAVDYLHGAGLVHRDIKASNVVLDRGGRVVLMDFGVARDLDRTAYTMTGAALGTPETMSPEQIRGERAGSAADIYALGVLTYQMLAGHPPFVGDTAYVLHSHAYNVPPALRNTRPDLPEAVSWAVNAALEKDEADRPTTARAFLELMNGAVPLERSSAVATKRRSTAARHQGEGTRRARAGLVILGIGVMAAFGLGAALLVSGGMRGRGLSSQPPASRVHARPSSSPSSASARTLRALLPLGQRIPVNKSIDADYPVTCNGAVPVTGLRAKLTVQAIQLATESRILVFYSITVPTAPGVSCTIHYDPDAGLPYPKGPDLLYTLPGGADESASTVAGGGIAQFGSPNIYGSVAEGTWDFSYVNLDATGLALDKALPIGGSEGVLLRLGLLPG